MDAAPLDVELRQVLKIFNGDTAVCGVNLSIKKGEFFSILGPSGCGKTTTLRIIYSLLRPDQGSAMVDGYDTQKDSLVVRQKIGALPDSKGIYPRLTARENIRYYGRLHGMSGAALEKSIDQLIKLLDMQDIEHRRTEGFSTGERVKVAIGRALVHEPQNVLLDEPTNGLDVTSTRSMRTFIRRLSEEGKCVLFSSHIMQEVSALCSTIHIVSHGQIAAQGTPEEILAATGQSTLEDAFVYAVSHGTAEGA